ncbi:MAG: CatB-related O-acetyltransferase [Lachnospiraceae bacterium]|nr:CatB-related O-acetyltransferase [Lachnospiraceae bacterium]
MNLKQRLKKTSLYYIYRHRKDIIKLEKFRERICRRFPDNSIIPMNVFPEDVLSVGRFSYGELNVVTFSDKTKLTIGNCVSIAQNVTFILDAEHHTDTISTFPFKVQALHLCESEAFSKGDIIIDDDVWVGYGATILSGVHIGQGAVIAAGALVIKDVEPYTVVGGVPAAFVKKRFSQELVDELMKIDYSKLDETLAKKHLDELYKPLKDLSQLSWMPKK